MTEPTVPGTNPPPPQKHLYGRGTLLAIGVAVVFYAGITSWKLLPPTPQSAVPAAAAKPEFAAPATDAPATSTDAWSGEAAASAPEAAPAASPEAATPDAARQEGSQ